MNRFSANHQLQESRTLAKHYVFHMPDLPDLSWDEVVSCMNYNVKEKIPHKTQENLGLVLHSCSNLPKILDVLDEFAILQPEKNPTAHLYISFSEKSKTFGWHKDFTEVIFWQAIGTTLFSVKQDDTVFKYELHPNDVIYIPKGMWHSTEPLTSRVGVSMGFDKVYKGL